MTKVLLITGPAGVGKSTLNWEVSAQLAGRAIPDADFTLVRLVASNETLRGRLEKREIGPSLEDQVRRALRQATEIRTLGGKGVVELSTDGKAPQELALELLNRIGWLTERSRF